MSIEQNVMVGQEFVVRAFAGKDGKIISRLPDGRPLLFGDQFIMTPKLRHGDIVKARVIKPTPTYILLMPVSLESESMLQFEPMANLPEVQVQTVPNVPTRKTQPHVTHIPAKKLAPAFETFACPHCGEPFYVCPICKSESPDRPSIEQHMQAHASQA